MGTYYLTWDEDGRTIIDGDTFCSGTCQPGDIIVLPSGTTNDGLYMCDLHGSAANPIIIKNTSGNQTIIDTNDVFATPPYGNGIWMQRSDYVKIDGSNGYDESDEDNLSHGIRLTDCSSKGIFLNHNVSELEIQYLEIDNIGLAYGSCGIGISEGSKIGEGVAEYETLSGLYVHHNYIHDVTTEGMYLGSTGSCITADCCKSLDDGIGAVRWYDVEVYKNRVDSTGWDGISTGCCQNTLVYNNYITEAGLDDFEGAGQGLGLSLNRGFGGTVYNNRIIGTQKEGIAWLGPAATDIYNNVIADTGRMAAAPDAYKSGILDVGTDSSSLTVRYNTFVNIAKKAIKFSASQTGLVQDNLFVNVGDTNDYGNATATNPGVTKATVAECNFEDAPNDNYRLTSSTPSDILDAGQSSGYPTYDQDGVSRPMGSATDLGAYEFVGGVPYTRSRGILRQKPRYNVPGGRFR